MDNEDKTKCNCLMCGEEMYEYEPHDKVLVNGEKITGEVSRRN